MKNLKKTLFVVFLASVVCSGFASAKVPMFKPLSAGIVTVDNTWVGFSDVTTPKTIVLGSFKLVQVGENRVAALLDKGWLLASGGSVDTSIPERQIGFGYVIQVDWSAVDRTAGARITQDPITGENTIQGTWFDIMTAAGFYNRRADYIVCAAPL